jgi:hypothetical protein
MSSSTTLRRLYLGTVGTLLCGRVLCAPHLEPCDRRANDYEERVEQLMRDAWPKRLQLLVIMYGLLPERAIGLATDDNGVDLIRLEFDQSFWYSSWRDVDPSADKLDPSNTKAVATEVYRADGGALGVQVLDFSSTQVGVTTLSIPISEQLGISILDAFERGGDAARIPEDTGFLMSDGYAYEILLSNGSCVELNSPPPESDADKIADLVRFLVNRLLSWQPAERESFEAEVARMLEDAA